jgi:Gram-negative bacterial TonB protein C-terminal
MLPAAVIAVSVLVSLGFSQEKGTCPGFLHVGKMTYSKPKAEHKPTKIQEPAKKPVTGATYLGRVILGAAISDQGYVCEAEVIQSLDSKIDDQVLESFRKRHFQPLVQNSKPVPTNVIVRSDLWRKPDGEVVEFPDPKLPKL